MLTRPKPENKSMYSDDEIIQKALEILSARLHKTIITVSSPIAVKEFLTVSLSQEEREIFGVLWLNIKNEVISSEHLFYGSLTSASVYPREVVKAALKVNAAAAICYHNHPSGSVEPSNADNKLTSVLKDTLALIDVRLLDHIIVAGVKTHSFAENGQI